MPSFRAILLILIAALAACDRSADAPPPPAKPVAQPSPGIAAPITRDFADDAAFATFAASLEPSFAPSIPVIQLFRGGTWACGYRRDQLNYILWPLDPKPGELSTYHLDAELGDAPDTLGAFPSRDKLVRVAPDGSWGYFVWPTREKLARAELWRLPLKAGEKPVKFHTFADVPAHLASPSISDDGRLLLTPAQGGWSLLLIDPKEGSATTVPLALPDELKPRDKATITLELAGLGGMIYIGEQVDIGPDDKRDLRFFLGVGSLAFTENPLAARIEGIHWLLGNSAADYQPASISPDGRMLLLNNVTDPGEPASLWRLPAQAGEKPAMIGALEQTRETYSALAAWSRDGKRTALYAANVLHLFDTAALAADIKAAPLATFTLTWNGNDITFTRDNAHLILSHRMGGTTIVPLDAPREVDAKIGEARIAWDVPRDPPAIAQWPALSATASIKHTEGVPSTLIVDVHNNGAGHARQVRSTLTIAPPLAAPAADPAKPAAAIAQLGPLHHGTIGPSQSIKRYLDLPADPLLFNKARRFSVSIDSKFGFNPAPIHWLHLPRTIKDEAEYHALAKTIFEAASKAIIDARGKPFDKQIRLVPLAQTGYGFTARAGQNVMYQNPFVMDDSALRINRAVMQVDSRDDLMRHAQMMLFWYLPHELVHCADSRTSWATEFVANTIQPYVTAKMLESMPDAPYTAQSMAFVYDRYVEKLRPHLKDEEITRIERFIQNNGEGEPPWNMSASDLFSRNTPAYVYFGARINQHSWSKQSRLEDLCAKYLP